MAGNIAGPPVTLNALGVVLTAPVISRSASPVFCTVIICVAEVVWLVTFMKLSAPPVVGGVAGTGVVSVVSGRMPNPVSITIEVIVSGSPGVEIVMVASCAPALSGVNVTSTIRVPPAGRAPMQSASPTQVTAKLVGGSLTV